MFKNGRNRAVRIPRDMDIFGDEVILRKREDGSIEIMPLGDESLADFLRGLKPLGPEDWGPDIEDHPPEPLEFLD